MAHETALYRDDVEQVRRQWTEWRSTHAVRSRLPEELWAAAVELVQRDGIDVTARALDVDKPSLRKWAGRLHPAQSPRTRRRSQPKQRANALPAFVELLASGSGGVAASCLVEVESPRGAKLRLELKGIQTSELAELIRAFAAA
jgi:transposase-like protein